MTGTSAHEVHEIASSGYVLPGGDSPTLPLSDVSSVRGTSPSPQGSVYHTPSVGLDDLGSGTGLGISLPVPNAQLGEEGEDPHLSGTRSGLSHINNVPERSQQDEATWHFVEVSRCSVVVESMERPTVESRSSAPSKEGQIPVSQSVETSRMIEQQNKRISSRRIRSNDWQGAGAADRGSVRNAMPHTAIDSSWTLPGTLPEGGAGLKAFNTWSPSELGSSQPGQSSNDGDELQAASNAIELNLRQASRADCGAPENDPATDVSLRSVALETAAGHELDEPHRQTWLRPSDSHHQHITEELDDSDSCSKLCCA
jgi:hypothetical protein